MSIHTRRFYDPNVDPHLQKFFSRPAVQQHIRSQKMNEAMDRAPPLYRQILERFTAESRSHGAPPTIANGQIGPSGGGGTTSADVCTCEGRGACFHCYFRTRRLQILQSEAKPNGRPSRYQPTAMEAVVAGLESLAPRPPSSRPASAGSIRASHGGRSDIVPHRPPSRPSSARSTRSATSNTYTPTIGSPPSDLQTYGFFGKDLRGTKRWGAGPALPPKIQRVARNPAPPPPRCAQYSSPTRELAAAHEDHHYYSRAAASGRGSRPTSAASSRRSNEVVASYSSPPKQHHSSPPSSSPRGRRSTKPVKSDYDALVLQSQRWSKAQSASGSTRHVAFEDSADELLSAFAASGEDQEAQNVNRIEANMDNNVPHQTMVAGQYIRRINSATKIQALVRGWLSRRALEPRSAAATCIQRAVKRRLRNKKLASQIRLFQRIGRSYIGRRKFCFVAQRIIMSRWTGTVHNELEKHVIEAHHDSLFFASSLLLILSAERENRIKIVRSWDSTLLYFTEVEMEIRERECRKGIARRAALYYKDYLKPAMALDRTHIHQRGVIATIQREALLDLVSNEAEERNIIAEFVQLEKEERYARKDIYSDSTVAFGSITHLHQHDWVRMCERRRMEIQARPPPSPPAAPTKHMLDFGGEDGNDGFDIDGEANDDPVPTTNDNDFSPLPPSRPTNPPENASPVDSKSNVVEPSASEDDIIIPPVTMGELLQQRSRGGGAHQNDGSVTTTPPQTSPPQRPLIIQQEETRRLDDDDDDEGEEGDDVQTPSTPREINPFADDDSARRDDGKIMFQYPAITEQAEEEEEEELQTGVVAADNNNNNTSSLQPPTHVVVEGVSIPTQPPAEPAAGDMFLGEDGNYYYYEEVEETEEDGEEEEIEEGADVNNNENADYGEDEEAYENSDNDSLPIL